MNKLGKQLVRHALVGGFAFLIDYGILVFLTSIMQIDYLVSSGISFTVSIVINYILSVQFVFDVNEAKSPARNFTTFVVLSCIGLLMNQWIMSYLVEAVLIYYAAAKILSAVVVTIYNFITRKIFLEKDVHEYFHKKSWV